MALAKHMEEINEKRIQNLERIGKNPDPNYSNRCQNVINPVKTPIEKIENIKLNIYKNELNKKIKEKNNFYKEEALKKYTIKLLNIEEWKRYHSYLLSPYVFYHIEINRNNAISRKEKFILYPILSVIGKHKYKEMYYNIHSFIDSINKLNIIRCYGYMYEDYNEINLFYKKECKKKLQIIYSLFDHNDDLDKTKKIHYFANMVDVENFHQYYYMFGIKDQIDKHQLSDNILELIQQIILSVLWKKLTTKGYTLGCDYHMPDEWKF